MHADEVAEMIRDAVNEQEPVVVATARALVGDRAKAIRRRRRFLALSGTALVASVIGVVVALLAAGSSSPEVRVITNVPPTTRPGVATDTAPTTAAVVPPPGRLLLTGATGHSWEPCQESLFAAECATAVASGGVEFDLPPLQEFITEYTTAAAAVAAAQSQRTRELSSPWLCSVASQCPVSPVDVSGTGRWGYAVTFSIGQRGNLSETRRLATVPKGIYVVNLSWTSASGVSANRVTSSDAAQSLLKEALAKVP